MVRSRPSVPFGQGSQSGDVRVAVRSVQRRRRLEPLQQRLVLRVVREPIRHRDGEHLAWLSFDQVESFCRKFNKRPTTS